MLYLGGIQKLTLLIKHHFGQVTSLCSCSMLSAVRKAALIDIYTKTVSVEDVSRSDECTENYCVYLQHSTASFGFKASVRSSSQLYGP